MRSSAWAMSRSQMVSCRRAACWARLAGRGRSVAVLSFAGFGGSAFSASSCYYYTLHYLLKDKDAAPAELDALYEKWEQLSEEAVE